eukprot:TRINITY_DN2464_c0_g1_i1.p1 TRINITY_DN2464_c0_g1~~TRINITY_DN2464_c0_g1_i1.p1  ORF type:complete len:257 (+),score=49.98 TRINITY_DN2464_c0_g1_i1:37-771(+)
MGGLCGTFTREKKSLRLIILGISGSGKSTFSKQMKYINTEGFEYQEIVYYKQVIHRNVFIGIRELIKLAERENIEFSEENAEHVKFINELTVNIYDEPVSSENIDMIVSLWEDEGMQKAWEKAQYFQIQMTNFSYLMENLERISQEDYQPTVDDVLRARQRTTGTYNVCFEHQGHAWEIVDVGGQMPERMKWEQIMDEGCGAIIYFTALDEYNTISAEDTSCTKMNISVQVWEEVKFYYNNLIG